HAFERREGAAIDATSALAADATWSAGVGLALVDPATALVFQARHLRLALDSGDPARVARAYAMEASLVATAGVATTERIASLVNEARALATDTNDVRAHVWIKAAESTASFMRGRWREALERCDETESFARAQCADVAWEVEAMRIFALSSLDFLGDIAALRARVPAMLADGKARGDRFGVVHARIGHATVAWLAADDPEGARREVHAAMAALDDRGSSALGEHGHARGMRSARVQDYYAVVSRAQIGLYSGRPDYALAVIDEWWRAIESAMLLRVEPLRIVLRSLRARAALASAVTAPADRRAALLSIASRDARVLESEAAPWAQPMAMLLRAGEAALGGANEIARDQLARAIPAFEEHDMALHALVARLAVSRFEGALGARVARRLVQKIRGKGVDAPWTYAAMMAPGLVAADST
ncbi:MAG: hypothetical protein ACHREM_30780, partial [Polyangiales bacterium]